MCEPTTIAVIGIGLTLLGGAYAADASKKAGQAQQEQGEENAKAADNAARNTTLSAQVEEDRRRQQTRQMLAAQRTTLAANNVDMSTGTPMEILGDTAAIGEQDALTIRANAARQAWGYQVEANNERNGGRMAKAAGQNAATGTYLTTAASAFGMGATAMQNRAPKTTNAPKYTTTSTPNTNYSYGSGARYA